MTNSEDNKNVTWAGRSAIWAVVIGLVGFLSGSFGPMIFSPGANQGPLLGVFITGPIAFVAGGLFGAISAFNKLSTRHNVYVLIICSITISGFTLNLSMPEPRYLGFVVDAEIRDCKSAQSAVDTAISRWDNTTWSESYMSRPNWKSDVQNMLKKDKGVVLDLFVFRKIKFNENQKPWNKGQRFATEWTNENSLKSFYARSSGASCNDYTDTTRRLFFPKWEASTVSPPDKLPSFLGLHVLEAVPQEYQMLVK